MARKKAPEVTPCQITDDVPVPVKSARYPVKDLEPGQSFSVPEDEAKVLRGAVGAYRKKMKDAGEALRFSVRTDPLDPEGSVRCWRLE